MPIIKIATLKFYQVTYVRNRFAVIILQDFRTIKKDQYLGVNHQLTLPLSIATVTTIEKKSEIHRMNMVEGQRNKNEAQKMLEVRNR